MASRESARSNGIFALLEAKRNEVPSIIRVPCDKVIVQDGDIIRQLEAFKGKKECRFSAFVKICDGLNKNVVKVTEVRYNKWGKMEIYLPEFFLALKSAKASPEELQSMPWVQFPGNDDDQKQFLNDMVSVSINSRESPKLVFYVRIYHLNTVKDTFAVESTTSSVPGKESKIVYAKLQIIRPDLPPSVVAASSYPVNHIPIGGPALASEPSVATGSEVPAPDDPKAKASKKSGKSKAASDLSEKEPARKRSKKSASEAPIPDDHVLEGPTSSQAIHFEIDNAVQEA